MSPQYNHTVVLAVKRTRTGLVCWNQGKVDWKPPIDITIDARTQWRFTYVCERLVKAGEQFEVPYSTRIAMNPINKRPSGSGAKYWEMIADGLHRAGCSYGVTAFLTPAGRTMQCVDAHKDGKRYLVHAEELGAAFLELEAQCREDSKIHAPS